MTQIDGTVSKSLGIGTAQANWKGGDRREARRRPEDHADRRWKYIRFEVTLTNNSGAALADLRYMRTLVHRRRRGFLDG
ncbi:hypothetical protein AB5I41_17325 [Sphingomonas sp. MMS24-JH45]